MGSPNRVWKCTIIPHAWSLTFAYFVYSAFPHHIDLKNKSQETAKSLTLSFQTVGSNLQESGVEEGLSAKQC